MNWHAGKGTEEGTSKVVVQTVTHGGDGGLTGSTTKPYDKVKGRREQCDD